MSYSIIRIAKVKSKTNTRGIQKHVQRQNKNYENLDIDLENSYLNYDLVNDNLIDFNQKIDEKIEQNYKGERKIRKDAVKHIDGLITSDNSFFEQLTPEETKMFFEHAKSFLEQEYGKDNLLYATVHMDELTPHMHYGVVPITKDGRLSAKEVVGNKKALTEFQDRFNEYINSCGYELSRGISRKLMPRQHEQVSRYKQLTDYHKEEYERQSQKLDHIKQESKEVMEKYQNALNVLKIPLNIPYKIETEKVGGLFNKETQETGNVVIDKNEFESLQEQVTASQLIIKDYEYIKEGLALKEAKQRCKQLDSELREEHLKNEELVDDYNNLADSYNDLLEQNKEKDKALNQSYNLFNNVFRLIKGVMKEEAYHRLIDYIDNHLESSKMRETMIVDDNDEQFFKKKYQRQEPEIIFEDERDDGYSL
ncbi:TPA: plasmid recombination protein [Staphylococcus aureus]|nr:plasmid recombination protein [Staphylococcus aureus]HDZ7720867.1 plasmid recombination protein [Staphylococcus aureus]HEI5544954.1 plasmid recombination protein [Staphylococcus aureus]HEI5545018.1 plasmid recombination protein [Staphylococcus aureus]